MRRAMMAAMVMAATTPTLAQERRCGWLHNPGPANWTLEDRDGRWILWSQGQPITPVMMDVTGMTAQDWVRPLGNYGYGCACLTVVADPATRIVSRVTASQQLPIARCEADRALASPR